MPDITHEPPLLRIKPLEILPRQPPQRSRNPRFYRIDILLRDVAHRVVVHTVFISIRYHGDLDDGAWIGLQDVVEGLLAPLWKDFFVVNIHLADPGFAVERVAGRGPAKDYALVVVFCVMKDGADAVLEGLGS